MSRQLKEIEADLDRRGLSLVSVIAKDPKGHLTVIAYDNNGLVTFISGPHKHGLHINASANGKSRVFRPVCEIKWKKNHE